MMKSLLWKLAGIFLILTSHVTAIAVDDNVGPPCRADLDCNPTILTNSKHWRCLHAPGEIPKPQNNCHIPGPYTVGNSTCRCSVGACPTTPAHQNSSRIQYLMIGDSISLGMESSLRNILTVRGWDLTHNSGNANSVNVGVHCLEEMVRGSWDVISFNFGLHGLAHDTEWLTDEQYRALFRKIVSRLASLQKVRLVWVTTTPVPTVPVYNPKACNDTSTCLNPPRYDHDVVRRNHIAAEEIRAVDAKIETVDLYAFVLSHCGGKPGYSDCKGFQRPANVHYTQQGWDLMAGFLAGALLEEEKAVM